MRNRAVKTLRIYSFQFSFHLKVKQTIFLLNNNNNNNNSSNFNNHIVDLIIKDTIVLIRVKDWTKGHSLSTLNLMKYSFHWHQLRLWNSLWVILQITKKGKFLTINKYILLECKPKRLKVLQHISTITVMMMKEVIIKWLSKITLVTGLRS